MVRLMIGITVGFLVFPTGAWGLKDYRRAMPKKINSYLSEGVFIGGVAGRGFSLRNVTRRFGAKSKIERVVVDIGDENGEPLIGPAAYFHIEVDQQNSRVVMDLSQVQRSKLSVDQLKKIFSKSPYVALESIGYDPQDRATNLTLRMKRPIMVEIFSPEGEKKPGRIVMDLKPGKLAMIEPKKSGKNRKAR